MRALLILCCLLIVGCAHSGPRFDRAASLETAARDPWENTNRTLYDINMTVDRYTLRPISSAYRTVIPRPARQGVSNFFSTVHEPTNAVNALLQGKPKRAFRALDRLLINGVLGLTVIDHATTLGLEEQPNDFGQTLAVWGVSSGPLLVFPVLGTQTVRDGTGFLVDLLLDPVSILEWSYLSREERYAKLGGRVIDIRSNIAEQGEQLLRGTADEYATVRSAWLQLRRIELYDGDPPPLDDYDEDEEIEPYPDDLPPPEPAGSQP